jgi:hypothetical protein
MKKSVSLFSYDRNPITGTDANIERLRSSSNKVKLEAMDPLSGKYTSASQRQAPVPQFQDSWPAHVWNSRAEYWWPTSWQQRFSSTEGWFNHLIDPDGCYKQEDANLRRLMLSGNLVLQLQRYPGRCPLPQRNQPFLLR